MNITLQELRGALKGQRRADEAIFWFCHAWHSGKDSALYQILREVPFTPRRHSLLQIANDPEMLYGFEVLDKLVRAANGGTLSEAALNFVLFDSVQEGDVLIHGRPSGGFFPGLVRVYPCIDPGWPCRVFKERGALGVMCAEGPSGASFHRLEPTSIQCFTGTYVKGFMR